MQAINVQLLAAIAIDWFQKTKLLNVSMLRTWLINQVKEISKMHAPLNNKPLLFQNCTIKWNIALPVQFMQELLELEAVKIERSEFHQKDLELNKSQLFAQQKLRHDKIYHLKIN